MRQFLLIVSLLMTVPALAGPRVVVSVLPLAGVVEAVSCGAAQVHVLVPPGANPATWAPTLRDREAVQAADLLVRVGHAAFAFERRWLGDLTADRDDMERQTYFLMERKSVGLIAIISEPLKTVFDVLLIHRRVIVFLTLAVKGNGFGHFGITSRPTRLA